MLEKVIDATGKAGVLGVPVSEAADRMGWLNWLGDPYVFQLASAAAAITLVVDRMIRLYWTARDRSKESK